MGTGIMRAASISVQRYGICGCYINNMSKHNYMCLMDIEVSDVTRTEPTKSMRNRPDIVSPEKEETVLGPHSHLHCVFCFPILLWKQTKTKVSSIDFNGFQFGSVC